MEPTTTTIPTGNGHRERTGAAGRALAILERSLSGSLLLPGDDAYERARTAFNLRVDQRPAAIATPDGERDVVAIVRHAGAAGFRVAAQRTAHNAGPLVAGGLADTIIVRTDEIGGVEIDPAGCRARARAATLWGEVIERAAGEGLAALHGSSPTVGVVGYSLGGGIGWYARSRGLQANALTAVELVTGDGDFRRVDAEAGADLFWALRGGGGNFGIVTAVEFELFEPGPIEAGWLFFERERAHEVLAAWARWTGVVGNEVTSIGRLARFPDAETLPEQVRGRDWVAIEAVILADAERAEQTLAPLRNLGPAFDTFAQVGPDALADLHRDPPAASPYVAETHLLTDLPAAAVGRFAEATAPGYGCELVHYEIRHLGGALADRRPGQGALATIPGRYLAHGAGAAATEAATLKGYVDLAAVHDALGPWVSPGRYMNFVEVPAPPSSFYAVGVAERLRRIRRRHDPRGVVRANHSLDVIDA